MTLVLDGGRAQKRQLFSGGQGLGAESGPLDAGGVSLRPRASAASWGRRSCPLRVDTLTRGLEARRTGSQLGCSPPQSSLKCHLSGMLPSSELRLPSLECGAWSMHRDVFAPTPLPRTHHQPTSEASMRGGCSPL